MAFKNRVVVRYADGRVAKGFTFDFLPNKESFHLVDSEDERKVTAIVATDLKAIFFVKSFAGNKEHRSSPPPCWGQVGGQRLKVTFRDGEVVYGTTTAYTPGRRGFFIVPADETQNNERAYVFADAAASVEILTPAAQEATASAGRAS
jgi:hypothetical protein